MQRRSEFFATATRARRDGAADPAVLAARCWPRDGAQRALSLWAEQVQPLSSALSYRIAVRARTGPASLRSGLRPALAVTALVVILATSWAVDFRYQGIRTVPQSGRWALHVVQLQTGCQNSPSGEFRLHGPTDGSFATGFPTYEWIPCSRIKL